MTLEEEIRAEAKKNGVLPYFVEKEYLQHLFLSHLFKSGGFVLRGGACLRIAYGYERFPRSLELASTLPGRDVKKAVHMALEGMSSRVDHSLLSERLHEGGYEAMVEFKGPLYYGASRNTNILIFSVEFRSPLLEPKRLKVAHTFVSEYWVWGMQIREVLAEKLFSLALRKRPEDAYDAWRMLKRGVELDWGLVEKKASQQGRGFVKPSPPFCEREGYEKALKNTLSSMVPYKDVVRGLEGFLSREKPVKVATSGREYKVWLTVAFILGGLLAVSYVIIQEGQKEAFTVLYFSDPANPILYDSVNKTLFVNFTVENHEYKGMDYLYRLTILSVNGSVLVQRNGGVELERGKNVAVSEKLPFNNMSRGGRLYVELFLNGTNTSYRKIWQRIK
jgi:predicted nucleotidyltransferase component of viral defense system